MELVYSLCMHVTMVWCLIENFAVIRFKAANVDNRSVDFSDRIRLSRRKGMNIIDLLGILPYFASLCLSLLTTSGRSNMSEILITQSL